MNRLSEGKLTTTMRDAIIRNKIAEEKMKTTLNSLLSVNKKEVNSLEYKKELYEKKRAQLEKSLSVDNDGTEKQITQQGMPRSPSPRPDGRHESQGNSPATPRLTSSNFRKNSEPSFITIRDLNNIQSGKVVSRQRSRSMINTPSIEISEVESLGAIKLPLISSTSHDNLKPNFPSQLRRISAGEISNLKGQNRTRSLSSSSLTPSQFVPGKAARSAPSSPVLPRKSNNMPGTQLPSPRGIPRKRMSKEMRELSGILDGVQQKQVPNLTDSIKVRDSRCMGKKGKAQENKPMTRSNGSYMVYNQDDRRNSKPVVENKMDDQSNSTEVEDLAESMDKLKFCKYLRGHNVNLEDGQNLPKELIPSSLIIGHTKTAMKRH